MKYYVYRHIRLDKNEPFYVGIGTNKEKDYYFRARHTTSRNVIWKNITAKTNYEIEIIFESEDSGVIKDKEKEFIKLYGRIDNKTGILANLTDGGDGQLFRTVTPETRQKISKWNSGRKRPIEMSEKLRKTKIGSRNPQARKVIDTKNGKVYETIKEAAEDNKLVHVTLFQYLSGKRKNKTTLKYFENEDTVRPRK